ncbi:MAG: glycerophosphodiester phosphodiesterase [Dehalococcoidia bacterium]
MIAHRGLHAGAPENSLGAIAAALAAGIDRVEVDVRLTRDGHLVLLHDPVVDRVTTGSGSIARLTLAEVARLRLADGSGLVRLEEALDACRGRAVLCIDTKDAEGGPPLLRALTGREGDVQVWSLHRPVAALLASAGVTTAVIANGVLPQGIGEFSWRARSAGAWGVSFFPADLERHVAAACANAGLAVLCGTPNDMRTWTYLREVGVSGIITDRPLGLRSWLHGPGRRGVG